MCLDCSGVTTENSAICVCFLISYADSIVVTTLTATLVSIIVNSEWEIIKIAVSVNFFNGVTVPVVYHFDGWSTKAVIVFVVVGGIVRASSVMTGWGFVVVSFEAFLTGIVKCGKCMRPSVVSLITQLFLIKCNPITGLLFITMKCSAKIKSPVSKLSVVVANGCSNWPFANCIWKLGELSTLRMLFGAFLFCASRSG